MGTFKVGDDVVITSIEGNNPYNNGHRRFGIGYVFKIAAIHGDWIVPNEATDDLWITTSLVGPAKNTIVHNLLKDL